MINTLPQDPPLSLVVISGSQRAQATKWCAQYAVDHAKSLNCDATLLDLRGLNIHPCTQK